MLNDKVFNAHFLPFGEQLAPIGNARAHVRHCAVWRPVGVLHVHQAHASTPAREIVERILTTVNHPVQVDLELHVARVSRSQQHVVRQLSVDGFEFEIMIVIGECEPAALQPGAQTIEAIGEQAVLIERLALLGRQRGHYQIFVAEHVRIVHGPDGIRLEHRQANMS